MRVLTPYFDLLDWFVSPDSDTTAPPLPEPSESPPSPAVTAFSAVAVEGLPKKVGGPKFTGPLVVILLGNWAAEIGAQLVTGSDPEERLSNHIYDRERKFSGAIGLYGPTIGAAIDTTVGRLADGLMVGIELLWNDVAIGRRIEREKIRKQALDFSETFGRKMRRAITRCLVDSIEVSSGKIDWLQFETGLRELYSQSKNEIQFGYDELEYTGFLCKKAQVVKDLIAIDGSISPQAKEGLKRLVNEQIQDDILECRHGIQKIVGYPINPHDLLDPRMVESLEETTSEEQRQELIELYWIFVAAQEVQKILATESESH